VLAAVDVAAVLAEVGTDGVDDDLRLERGGGVVEVDDRLAQQREVVADAGHVKRHERWHFSGGPRRRTWGTGRVYAARAGSRSRLGARGVVGDGAPRRSGRRGGERSADAVGDRADGAHPQPGERRGGGPVDEHRLDRRACITAWSWAKIRAVMSTDPPPTSPLGDRPALWMLAVAYAFSWSVALALWATGGITTGPRHVVGGLVFMCGPAVAALVVRRAFRLPRRDLGLALSFDRWVVVAWIVPLVILALAVVASLAAPEVELLTPTAALAEQLRLHASPEAAAELGQFQPGVLSLLLVLQACVMGPLLNTPMMLSEELGWRGLLWSRWQGLGFWPHALATGFVWGLWHAPLIVMGHNYPDAPVLGVPMMIGFCMLLTPVLHHIRERGGSVWHACIFHGTINATATLASLCLLGGSSLLRGIVGVPGFLVLAAATVVVVMIRRAEANDVVRLDP
jgi:hypothetical protein